MGNNDLTAEPPNPPMGRLDLETVIRSLHDSDINVGIQTYDKGMQVWISDRLHRVREERLFNQSSKSSPAREDGAALWLHAAALRLFPTSPYSRRFKRGKVVKGDGDGEARPDYRSEVVSKS